MCAVDFRAAKVAQRRTQRRRVAISSSIGNDQRTLACATAAEIADEIERRLVGPMQVLDHQQDRQATGP
jgi:hypothetical protein